jgi:hypothetical protein
VRALDPIRKTNIIFVANHGLEFGDHFSGVHQTRQIPAAHTPGCSSAAAELAESESRPPSRYATTSSGSTAG